MSVKILGGHYKGFDLAVAKGKKTTRPTSVLLRRRIFDSFQNLEGFIFVDCYAGTGAMGVEALSRGACEVLFIEKSKRAWKCLEQNLNRLKTKFPARSANYKTFNCDFSKWQGHFKKTYCGWPHEKKEQTIFFFDPPYEFHREYKEIALEDILKGGWFKGQLWIESDRNKGLGVEFWEKEIQRPIKFYKQGSQFILVV